MESSGHTWHHKLPLIVVGMATVALVVSAWLAFSLINQTVAPKINDQPLLTTDSIVADYDHIWDIAFLPGKQLLFDERSGAFHVWQDGKVRDIGTVPDVYAVGEGGLLGLTVDPDFSNNHYMYACFDSAKAPSVPRDIRVARWKLSNDLTKMSDRTDIVTGMPITFGRHSGCRVK